MKPTRPPRELPLPKSSEQCVAPHDRLVIADRGYDFAAFAAFLRRSDLAWVAGTRSRDQCGATTCMTASAAMSVKVAVLMLTHVVLSFVAGSAIAADINGFRDVRFGDPPAKLGSERRAVPMPPIDTGGTEVCHARPSDRLQVGEAPVAEINYCFYKDRLFNVIVTTARAGKAFERIRAALEAAYGSPKEAFGMTFWGDWNGATGGSIMMLGGDTGGVVNITSNDIKRQRSAVAPPARTPVVKL